MPRIHAIVNPAGRDGKAGKRWPKIQTKLEEAGFDVEADLTTHVNHAAAIAYGLRQRYADDTEPPLVVAVGGDGTVHEVASGLRGGKLRLGIIPLGTGNDYARGHGYPMKDIGGTIEILLNGKDRSSPAYRLEAFPMPAQGAYPEPQNHEWDGSPTRENTVVRWVFLETDGGITANVSRRKLTQGKWIRGTTKYTYLGIRAILGSKKQKMWVKVDDGEPTIGSCDIYALTTVETFGGGYKVCPGMHVGKQKGSFVRSAGLSKIKMLRLMGPLYKGKHIGLWGITREYIERLEIRPVDAEGNPMDKPGRVAYITQSDGEPQLQAPATFQWHLNQLTVRGAAELAYESS